MRTERERVVSCTLTGAGAYLRRAEALAASSAACRLREMPGREIDCGPADPRLAWGNPQSFDTVSHTPPRVRSQSSHMDRGVNMRTS